VKADTVFRYVVQAELTSGWTDAMPPFDELHDARTAVRESDAVPGKLRVIERRITTVEEVMP
jgi:hypothetical protein